MLNARVTYVKRPTHLCSSKGMLDCLSFYKFDVIKKAAFPKATFSDTQSVRIGLSNYISLFLTTAFV